MVLLARAGTNAFRFSVCSVQSQLRLSTSCLGPVTKRQVDVFQGGLRSGRGSLRGLASGSGEPVRAGRLGAGVELRPYQTVVPEAKRLVVIGDVHGDIGERCFLCSRFKLAVLVVGKCTVLVLQGTITRHGTSSFFVDER